MCFTLQQESIILCAYGLASVYFSPIDVLCVTLLCYVVLVFYSRPHDRSCAERSFSLLCVVTASYRSLTSLIGQFFFNDQE